MRRISRRDALKLSATLPAAAALARFAPGLASDRLGTTAARPNIIVIVFDTMSGRNLSLYGYPRPTTPNFQRFAERAHVYNAHYAGGNFTVPGTASILTGLYPWTHRAINHAGFIARSMVDRNIFRLAGESYTRLAFSQNLWAVHLLAQFRGEVDVMVPPTAFSSTSQVIGERFPNDLAAAYISLDEFLFWEKDPPGSLILGLPERAVLSYRAVHAEGDHKDYPTGLPSTTLLPLYFRLEELYDGVRQAIARLAAPYLAYIHLWGVHLPYRPQSRFAKANWGEWQPAEKPRHMIGGKSSYSDQLRKLRRYDQYIASQDYEFGRLIDEWTKDGTLDNSYVFVTADHGESFERGTQGHTTPLLFEPLLRIPLVVSTPGQQRRVDIDTPTSSADILPTLAAITGQEVPAWCEGSPLPGIGGPAAPERRVYTVESKSTPALNPMVKYSAAVRSGQYKLVNYKAVDYDFFEMYDLKEDPEELNDLYPGSPPEAASLREDLLSRLDTADRPYRKAS